MKIEMEIEVPANRQIAITLPAEVPIGRGKIWVDVPTTSNETFGLFRPDDPAEAREFTAFLQMYPQLQESHAGQYVAVSGGQVVASGELLNRVWQGARSRIGDAAMYCVRVVPKDGMVFHSGLVTIPNDGEA